MRWLWKTCGLLALMLALAGLALPLLPTVPFLLLAAFCFARSSARLHDWLVGHPVLGPPIADWNRAGAIGRRAKVLASLSMLAAFGLSMALGVRPLILLVQALVLCAVALFIWSRPSA
ncbi:YbaN family protein [Paracoccaceae bacterium Fryx2]|nr:YbaN family protein [Paracoccaceae bacterium Fryx2]